MSRFQIVAIFRPGPPRLGQFGFRRRGRHGGGSCHQIGENAKNFVSPALNGVVGRKAGAYAGYNYSDANKNYSDANKNSDLTWNEPTLAKYLKNPRQVVPGAKMAFQASPGTPTSLT